MGCGGGATSGKRVAEPGLLTGPHDRPVRESGPLWLPGGELGDSTLCSYCVGRAGLDPPAYLFSPDASSPPLTALFTPLSTLMYLTSWGLPEGGVNSSERRAKGLIAQGLTVTKA